jgi:uncharacterized protein YkwD
MPTFIRAALDSRVVSLTVRRVLPALLIGVMIASAAPSPSLAAQAPSDPEARLLSLINQARGQVGRVALRWDSRLADVAQERSDDMARTGDLGHIGWTELTAMIKAEGIVWQGLAEALVKGTPRTPMESAQEAMTTWRNSQGHWDLLSKADFNYIALGMARASDGWYYWTAILLKGADRTAPTARMTSAKVRNLSGGGRSVALTWTGADVQLSVNTAGLRDFRVQRKVGSGNWVAVTDWTKDTSRSFSVQAGKTYRFRVRARDWNGNRSVWSAALTVTS